MRSARLLLVPLALVSPLAAGCGHDAPSLPRSAVAVVGDRTITRAQYEALMTQARQSYAAQKRSFPKAGTRAYESLKASAVRLLVEQAALEQKAPGLGVTIDGAQVEARRRMLIGKRPRRQRRWRRCADRIGESPAGECQQRDACEKDERRHADALPCKVCHGKAPQDRLVPGSDEPARF